MQMIHLFVRQNVADYETWRLVYDRFYSNPDAYGAPIRTVYQSIEDPNDITVEHVFKHLDDARALVSSTDLDHAKNQPSKNETKISNDNLKQQTQI